MVLRDGDIVFRLVDARTLAGCCPMSWFIADASGSRYSHTGIVAVEDGSVVVYDCSSSGIQRQPFAVWMLDCLGPFAVKRLKADQRQHISGVLNFCRETFEKQVPFDYGFQIDDRELYCVEMTEKAFRSQGLALSAPVLLGDWENLVHFPLTTFAFRQLSRFAAPSSRSRWTRRFMFRATRGKESGLHPYSSRSTLAKPTALPRHRRLSRAN